MSLSRALGSNSQFGMVAPAQAANGGLTFRRGRLVGARASGLRAPVAFRHYVSQPLAGVKAFANADLSYGEFLSGGGLR